MRILERALRIASDGNVRRYRKGMDFDQLETVRIVTESRLEPSQVPPSHRLDPPVLAALGLTPEFLEEVRAVNARSGRRFVGVVVQLVGHDGTGPSFDR
jgi:hypothetical protein